MKARLAQPRTRVNGASPRAPTGERGRPLPSLVGNQTFARLVASGGSTPSTDHAEREADRVAGHVLRSPLATVREGPQLPTTRPIASVHSVTSSAPQAVRVALRSGARPLEPATRRFFEARFHEPFGGIRVHTGASAERATQRLGARAFAVGEHVVVGAGEYRAGTPAGMRLLAHELAHVVQQRRQSRPRIQCLLRMTGPRSGARFARTADAVRWFSEAIDLATSEPANPQRATAIIDDLSLWIARLATPRNLDRAHRAATFGTGTMVLHQQAMLRSVPLQVRRHIGRRTRRRSGIWAYLTTQFLIGRGLLEFLNGERAHPVQSMLLGNMGRNVAAFFEGIVEGLQRSRIDAATARRLGNRLAAAVALNLTLPVVMTAGIVVGALGDVWDSLRSLVETLMSPREALRAAAEALSMLVSSDPTVANAFGREIGAGLATQIISLSRQNPVAFTYNLGRILGPFFVDILIALVTAGAGLVLRGVTGLARVMRLVRRLRPALRLVRRASSRIRRLLRVMRGEILRSTGNVRRRGNRLEIRAGRHTYRRSERGQWCRHTNPIICVTNPAHNAEIDRAVIVSRPTRAGHVQHERALSSGNIGIRVENPGGGFGRLIIAEDGRVLSYTGRIVADDLGVSGARTGTHTTIAARRFVRRLGNPNDDAGHALARMFGGVGGRRGRMVLPLGQHANRVLMREFEMRLARLVSASSPTDRIHYRLRAVYRPGQTRPLGVRLTAWINDQQATVLFLNR
jgi:hypothetical protein